MEPLIERPKVKPEGLLGDAENGNNNNSLSQPDLTTPSKSITCQPQARSTHIHPAQPCLTQPTSQPRDGAKLHTHCPNCTHAPHTNRVRNGGPCDRPAPGSLPKAASSSSSSGMKNSTKLQSNPSITSQSSKRSKSSSKSNSSQIPTEVQEGVRETRRIYCVLLMCGSMECNDGQRVHTYNTVPILQIWIHPLQD
ncbi:myoD family inhibitor isoform X4 [Oncorhynchus tshawytscha]|uniref:myoD family inhibitor isoform X4 n=1 Tax=Oncorhynchus tshawytscha TaxID=74940 RepID=UPI000D09810E|nr:myoD family inhibitor isoform X4 [Oncorhynchus tshawytscha]